MNTQGLTRYVLINRLHLLNWIDKQNLLGSVHIRDLAVGLGEWSVSGEAILRKWPLFLHFDRGLTKGERRDICEAMAFSKRLISELPARTEKAFRIYVYICEHLVRKLLSESPQFEPDLFFEN